MIEGSDEASSSRDTAIQSVAVPGSVAVRMVSTEIQQSMPEFGNDDMRAEMDFDSGDIELLEVQTREWADNPFLIVPLQR